MTDAPTHGTLMHYTTDDGLLGILRTKSIWASHIFYLNDTSEYQLIFERARDLVTRLNVLRNLAKEAPLLAGAIQTDLRPAGWDVFVASFSETWDDLSQWRAYT